jgi:glycosyltransferase involved in cell wall biosynthesis
MHAGAIPGKLFTYLSSGRPILVVGPAGCEAGRIVEKHNRGIAVASDDVAGLTDAVARLLDGRGRNGALDLSPQAVQSFEAQTVLGELATFFDEVTG